MKIDIRGKYIPIRTIKTQDEWEKIIEAFVALGAVEREGRKGKAALDYGCAWLSWSFIGINDDVEVVHYDREGSYYGEDYALEEITKEYLFSLCEQPSCSTDQFTSLSHEAATVIEALLDYIDGLPEDVESSSFGVDRDWVEAVAGELKELG